MQCPIPGNWTYNLLVMTHSKNVEVDKMPYLKKKCCRSIELKCQSWCQMENNAYQDHRFLKDTPQWVGGSKTVWHESSWLEDVTWPPSMWQHRRQIVRTENYRGCMTQGKVTADWHWWQNGSRDWRNALVFMLRSVRERQKYVGTRGEQARK